MNQGHENSHFLKFQFLTCLELAALKEAENYGWGQYLSIRCVNNTKLKYIYLNYAKWIFHYNFLVYLWCLVFKKSAKNKFKKHI